MNFRKRIDPKDCEHLKLRGKNGTTECPDCRLSLHLKTVEVVGSTKYPVPHKATEAIEVNDLGWYMTEARTIGAPL